jgi:Arc/MetJ family transcription regulator
MHILNGESIYTEAFLVTKRLIELDDELLVNAQRELGTSGVTDTVRTALVQVAASRARARQVAWLTEGGMAGLAEAGGRAEVWR